MTEPWKLLKTVRELPWYFKMDNKTQNIQLIWNNILNTLCAWAKEEGAELSPEDMLKALYYMIVVEPHPTIEKSFREFFRGFGELNKPN